MSFKDKLIFVLVGPFLQLNQIRKEIMGLKETIDGYTASITQSTNEIRSAFESLKNRLDNNEDIEEALARLGTAVGSLEVVENPYVSTDPGTVVPSESFNPPPNDATWESPSEPDGPEDTESDSA